MKQKIKVIFIIVLSVAILLACLFGVYAGDYYHAENDIDDYLLLQPYDFAVGQICLQHHQLIIVADI